jgi:hypothetical protein
VPTGIFCAYEYVAPSCIDLCIIYMLILGSRCVLYWSSNFETAFIATCSTPSERLPYVIRRSVSATTRDALTACQIVEVFLKNRSD